MSNDNIFKVTSDMLDGDGTFGKFVCKPLDRGYGITLGIAYVAFFYRHWKA